MEISTITKMRRQYRNGDFKAYYCQKTKMHIWVIGYFGGGSINYKRLHEAALDFSQSIGCPIDQINIDEIFKSRRFLRFKYMTSEQQNQKPLESSEVLKDVWKWLSD